MNSPRTVSIAMQRDEQNGSHGVLRRNEELGEALKCQQFEFAGEDSSMRRFGGQKYSDIIFPPDMTDKTVLDVASREGFFCFEALKRGARRTVGFEINTEFVERARKLGEIPDLPAEFRQVDVETYRTDETFDDVLALNVLQQVRNPFLLLEKLIEMTNERLILEVAGVGRREQKKLKLNWWRRLLFRGLRGLPIVYVNPNSLCRNRQRFYLSMDAVRCLLSEHRRVFSKVEVIPSPIKDRHILIAHKRRIDDLIVVAGPTSAGKTTLIDSLSSGKEPEVIDRLGIKNIKEWETLDMHQISQDTRTHLPRVIMHYDFLARVRWNLEDSQMTDFLDTVRSAKRVTILTLWAEPQQLRKQFEKNEIREYTRQRGTPPKNKKTLRLQKDYEDPQKIIDYYRAWFAFSVTLSKNHVVLSQSPLERFRTLDAWQGEYA